MNAIAMVLWQMFVWGGSIYLIEWRGWSAWWLILSMILSGLLSFEERRDG